MTGDAARGPTWLNNHLDIFRAVARVEQLTACLEDTREEAEPVALVAFLEEWLSATPQLGVAHYPATQ